MIDFRCNICGTQNSIDEGQKHRELLVCVGCGGNARLRGIVFAIQRAFLSTEQPLTKAMPVKNISGLGFTDSHAYANELARLFNFTNTYFHAEPFLDITSAESAAQYAPQDFVICSDVIEHVLLPMSALRNLRSLVKPGGVLILSVPYLEGYDSIEHFPQLHKWRVVELSPGRHVMVNERTDGTIETFANPHFHGGPGAVLEMRVFGEGDLLARLNYAGFRNVEILEANMPGIGYVWDYRCERTDWHGRGGKSCVMVCK